MAFWVYVLQSETTGKVYIGQTNDLRLRLSQHNDPNFQRTLHTKRNQGPWKLVQTETFSTRAQAMSREKALKSGQGRKWIREEILQGDGC